MNSLPTVSPWQNVDSNPSCAKLMKVAERELSSFVRAITEVFGSEAAFPLGEEWLQQLSSTKLGCSSAEHSLRLITIKTSTRLSEILSESENGQPARVPLGAEAA
jgi:hypothetical protein